MKKLNNKGFTLVELLAVVVILAVVMGIAMTSVFSAMNKSRGGSLADTALVVANAFSQKHTESLVGGGANLVYGLYDFTTTNSYYLDDGLKDDFNIANTAYELDTSGVATGIDDPAKSSFVSYDHTTGKFIVCMKAKSTGSYYVANYAVGGGEASTTTSITIGSSTFNFDTGDMWACSDGTRTWQ